MSRKLSWFLAVCLIGLTACSTRSDPENTDILGAETPIDAPAVQVDPARVIDHLKAAGLPLERVDFYNAENDPFKLAGRPDRYITKAVFHDTRFNPEACRKIQVLAWDECGGTVESFANASDLRKWTSAIVIAREQTPNAPPEYRYQNGLTLLRLGHVLTPEQAKTYEDAYKTFSP
jgi:hypothetical protein